MRPGSRIPGIFASGLKNNSESPWIFRDVVRAIWSLTIRQQILKGGGVRVSSQTKKMLDLRLLCFIAHKSSFHPFFCVFLYVKELTRLECQWSQHKPKRSRCCKIMGCFQNVSTRFAPFNVGRLNWINRSSNQLLSYWNSFYSMGGFMV